MNPMPVSDHANPAPPAAASPAAAWIRPLKSRPGARLKLICFPFAGGGGGTYLAWPNRLSRDIEVHAVQLPGREHRIRERPCGSMEEIVASLLRALEPFRDDRVAFFGHSMGALIAYEVAKGLQAGGGLAPIHVFLSGRRPPQSQRQGNFHTLPDPVFIAELRRLNGTPAQVFEDPELMALFLPVLRADYRVLETYRHLPGPPLGFPVSACRGGEDTEVSDGEMAGWRDLTSGAFSSRTFPGDHFYLNPYVSELTAWVDQTLSEYRSHP